MSAASLERLMAESKHLGPGPADPHLESLRRAIVLEDVLGITLTDEQISPDFLSDPRALQRLLPHPRPPV